ncbi:MULTISPECIES: DUF192 domain-containing protein [unclassified Janthinobacterium]|jgi:uncharacterized membrane protein (UPF0127 family)|uniref:DUF192 domain-containing protein n=1 Tax=unclassified Janthinobacterium TaxID=2610881 RepID=UPI001E3BA17A|nr:MULTISPECIES: DUF192 domain-containing protein [unclassified Janthinobacterium]MCC7641259.1 DUF192 domain-containing protein [Janthinobacterium sp. EB271-G4-3-1]MCC7690513.1 DUF192 domain-containing protein [Janthinobacterium sp. EB271-G4-3-2]
MKNCLRRLCLSIALLSCASMAQAQTRSLQLSAGMHLIQAEVAATEAQREQGLMYREKMAANAGMVFVFDNPSTQCMWMKNTPLPLSVAFIDASGKIVNIEDMQPHTLDSHCSTKTVPVRYALEMHLGWFKQKNIKPGMSIGNLPAAR